jgi:hypothetical protein
VIDDRNLSMEEALKQDQEFKASSSDPVIDIPAALTSSWPQPLYESDSLMITDFNRFFIQALIGNVPHVIWEHDGTFIIFSYENFHKQFSYVQVVDLFGGTNKAGKATKRWLDAPPSRKRNVPGIKLWPATTIIDPNNPKNKLFNLWRGWPTEPVRNDTLLRIILVYVSKIICADDRAKFHHIMDFHGHLFQRPYQKPSFGIALHGEEEGTGKSMFNDEMKKIVGKDYSFTTADPDDIFGRNNPGMDSCFLLDLEEIEWAMYRRYHNKFKNLFTCQEINISDKYEKQIV